MHGDYSRFSDKSLKRLKKGDYLIVAGDFGFLWDKTDKEDRILRRIGKKRFYTLFVEGCHDNYDLINSYPEEEFCGGFARQISGRLYHLSRGGIFNLQGVRVFAFGGGISPDISERAAQNRFWGEEAVTEEQINTALENLDDHDYKFDIAVTHEAPARVKQFLAFESNLLTRIHFFFDEVKEKSTFDRWFFGKLHRKKLIPPKFLSLFDDYEFYPTNDKERKKLERMAKRKR
jgi:hypothetical protein